MGKAKFCDRCGKFYLTNIDGNERTFTCFGTERVICGVSIRSDSYMKPFDLCNDCIDLFLDDYLAPYNKRKMLGD